MLVYDVYISQSITSVYYVHSIRDSFDFCLFIFPPDVFVKTYISGGFQLDHMNVCWEFGFHFLVLCIRQICV